MSSIPYAPHPHPLENGRLCVHLPGGDVLAEMTHQEYLEQINGPSLYPKPPGHRAIRTRRIRERRARRAGRAAPR